MLRRAGCLSKDFTRLSVWHIAYNQVISKARQYSQIADNEKLRILFCGSDDFSIASLNAIHRYSQESGSNVLSIDVAAKTDKRVGRGLKVIRPPPIKPVAQSLGLPVHQFDTFRGWNLPTRADGSQYINLIVAVSFGLLVPPRILGSCQYGGLNVHPSMLPDLKGSSPIEHTIINGYKKSGVTIQTLHPSKFDEGEIVMQTPEPGLDIPDPDGVTSRELRETLAPIGGEMLVDCLRKQRYLRPSSRFTSRNYGTDINHAPKLSPESRRVKFQSMDLAYILRLNRALGRLWTSVSGQEEQNGTRFIFGSDLREATPEQLKNFSMDVLSDLPVGLPFNVIQIGQKAEESRLPLLVKTRDGKILSFSEIVVSGSKAGPALASSAKAGIIEPHQNFGLQQMLVFKQPLG